jgi:hypothetical protein
MIGSINDQLAFKARSLKLRKAISVPVHHDSSTGLRQDEGNSGFIDLIDPASDYLLNQLRFFLNQLRLR